MLMCYGYRVREAANVSLIILIFFGIISCFLGMALWLILLTVTSIAFDFYCWLQPGPMKMQVQVLICLIRSAQGVVYATLLLIALNSPNSGVPAGYYTDSQSTVAYFIASVVFFLLGAILNLIFASIFWNYSKLLTLEAKTPATNQQIVAVVIAQAPGDPNNTI